jgi:hypothetical protein
LFPLSGKICFNISLLSQKLTSDIAVFTLAIGSLQLRDHSQVYLPALARLASINGAEYAANNRRVLSLLDCTHA